jgi:3-isopropylmalate dehydrogenase
MRTEISPSDGARPDAFPLHVLLTENLFGEILSAATLLRDGCRLSRPASAIEKAVERVLDAGLRAADLAPEGASAASCSAFAKAVVDSVESA